MERTAGYVRSVVLNRHRVGASFFCVCLALAAMFLGGCAPPALYSVNMKYLATGSARSFVKAPSPVGVTVASFEDLRKISDTIQIGRVIEPSGQVVPVLPRFVKPSQAITGPFKEFFRRAGFQVSAESPVWDLKEQSINKAWGPILVGGSIDELEVVCTETLIKKSYKSRVKLTVLFADTRTGKIFYRVTTESSSSLDDVLFSEEKLEDQINTTLSDAIEKIFDGKELQEVIQKVAGQKS